MEIEAKFRLPDSATLEQIAQNTILDEFTFSPITVDIVYDTYLDTFDRALFEAGYSCRRRKSDSGILITIKQLAHSHGTVYKRTELETNLPSDLQPSDWPPGPLRDLILKYTGNKSLTRLFDIYQKRIKRLVLDNGVPKAEVSLDRVQIRTDSGELEFLELEIEVLGPGTEKELENIIDRIKSRWNLSPEPLSKFEHGMAFVNSSTDDTLH